ncbi:MAG: LpxL/LpxP family Kdo(2)-lipid IV(A) lauroyl/palmitoleoyl acyltransferase [Gammaproteobacteria bacterium]|nr:LpxL/LpxP family Kdo(2)-lipid IV(A) lauroyl/palmitoleoyl acyltransferase [Gammaproteobacteria bacterium]
MSKKSNKSEQLSDFLSPRYWPTWLGFGVVWLAAQLPFPVQIRIGQGMGWLSYRFARERRRICRTNIALCFPELDAQAQARLVRETFISNGIGVMEVAMAWCRSPEVFRKRVTVSGLENLQAAARDGKGILLVCAHFTTLEFAGSLLSLFHKMDVTYRPHKNPLFETLMFRARQRLYGAVIDRGDVRLALRSLQQGHTVWYAPDQDYGPRHSVFVDFFGVPAATITATGRFASFNKSAVIFFSHYRNAENSGYHLDFSAPLQDYPSGDDTADAIRINGVIEAAIRQHPEQYLWLHKRFKTQAEGKTASPYRRSPQRRREPE